MSVTQHRSIEQVRPVYHRRVGASVVTVVGDGYLGPGLKSLRGIDTAEVERILERRHNPVSRRKTPINTFVVRNDAGVCVIDTGCGTFMSRTAGRQFENLEAAGVRAEEVSTVLLSHIHPDHSCGLTTPDTGRPYFPNAELVYHVQEHGYWEDEIRRTEDREWSQSEFVSFMTEQLRPYRRKTRLFEGSDEVFPGITSRPVPGHTPGHTAYVVEANDGGLVIWGDIVHVPEVQALKPTVGILYDVDPEQAVATRTSILEDLSANGTLVAGAHVPFPGLAYVEADGDGYRIVPDSWEYEISGPVERLD